MRSFALAIVGLAAMGHSLPTAEIKAVEERQTLGTPSVQLVPDSPVPVLAFPAPEEVETITLGKRDLFWLPDNSRSDADNIRDAELQLQQANEELADCDDPHRERALRAYVKQLELYLKKTAGIKNISAPPGTTTTFVPGKRDVAHLDDTENLFLALASQYTDKHPPAEIYQVLEFLASILTSYGRPPSIIFLGPATTEFGISTKEKRQIKNGNGSCNLQALNDLFVNYLTSYALNGPNAIQTQILQTVLTLNAASCGVSFTMPTGATTTITPGTTTPGAPITPNTPTTGAPMTPST